ncbi:MAG: tetratricopeptide repeat protein [Candidatus Bipolaricaulia bacterium]
MQRQSRSKRKYKYVIGGLLLGFGVVGLGLLLIYLVPEYIIPRVKGLATYKTSSFVFHYRRDATVAEEIRPYADSFDVDFNQIADFLGVGGEQLPDQIHVYISEDLNEMQNFIAERKSSGYVPLAVIDVLYGESPRDEIAELVADFGWGRPSSKILNRGVIVLLGEPAIDHELLATTLPERLFFPIQALRQLEESGRFPSRPYELFNAPDAPATVSLVQLRQLLRLGLGMESRYPPQQIIDAEAAALVEFLIEAGGVERFRALWATRSLEEGLQESYGLSLEALERSWKDRLQQRRVVEQATSPDYHALRGGHLMSLGQFAEARQHLERALSLSLGSESNELAAGAFEDLGKIYLYQGEWEEAARHLETAVRYIGWSTYRATDLWVHYTPDGLTDEEIRGYGARVNGLVERIIARLEVDRNRLPDQVILFLDRAEGFEVDAARGVAHLGIEAPVGGVIAEIVSHHMVDEPTRSEVLKRGLTIYLARLDDLEPIYQEAAEQLADGRWIPLEALDFDQYDDATVAPQTAVFVGYLIERYGAERFKRLWETTSVIGGSSLYRAVSGVYGRSQAELDGELRTFLRERRENSGLSRSEAL